jgi:acyl-CoA synthetase (NDP forming)
MLEKKSITGYNRGLISNDDTDGRRQEMVETQNLLTEVESKELLKKAGIPVIDAKLARTQKEAVSLSREMGFPVVLKISSPDVVHKSDSGGVKLGLANATQVGKAYSQIISSIKQAYPEARIDGVSVQTMAPPGVEVIVGMSKDAQFGPVLMFGLGGILVEVLKDVSFRIVPVTERDAREMIKEIKGYPVLQGYRGQKPASVPALEQLIVKVSRFVEKNPQIKELDLNPVFAYPDKAVAVDARIILE